MFRILLLGGSGLVGTALRRQNLPTNWLLEAPPHAACDLTHSGVLGQVIRAFVPDLVINAAALTNEAACAQDPEAAMRVNFQAVASLAAHCSHHDAPLIHLSCAAVFDGQLGEAPYAPDAPMNPQTAYAKSKMMGEEAVRHALPWHVILRSSILFGAEGDNLLTRALRHLETGSPLDSSCNQMLNPTGLDFLARSAIHIAEAILSGKGNGFGTFHLAGTPAVSVFDFLQAVQHAYAPSLSAPAPLIQQQTDNPQIDTTLTTDLLQAVYGIFPSDWREDLAQSLALYVAEKREPECCETPEKGA